MVSALRYSDIGRQAGHLYGRALFLSAHDIEVFQEAGIGLAIGAELGGRSDALFALVLGQVTANARESEGRCRENMRGTH